MSRSVKKGPFVDERLLKRIIEMNKAEKREELLNKLKEIKKYENLAEDLNFI